MAVTVTTPKTVLGACQPKSEAARLWTNLAVILVGSAILALSAKFKVPLPPVPFTLQTLAVAIIAAGAGWRIGVATVAVYLLEGLAGIPVFAGDTAGPAYFMGTTAGFLVGYLPMAYVIGRIADAGAAGNVALLFVAMVVGDALAFALGFGWLFAVATSITAAGGTLPGWLSHGTLLEAAFNGAIKPFILWDLLKMAFAAMTVAGAWSFARPRV